MSSDDKKFIHDLVNDFIVIEGRLKLLEKKLNQLGNTELVEFVSKTNIRVDKAFQSIKDQRAKLSD